jgi:hypothetical protein
MTRSMTRWTLAGCMALAVMGAATVFDIGSATAEAAPSVSPFAGSYVGADPRNWHSAWAVTISDGGRITSSYSSGGYKRSISGRVSDDESYSFTVTEVFPTYDDGPRDPRVPRQKYTYESAGTMALEADGNIVGTTNTGGSFVWIRQ